MYSAGDGISGSEFGRLDDLRVDCSPGYVYIV